MAVGPSAPPMIAIDAACFNEKPIIFATKSVKNIPIWAAAPRKMVIG